MCQSLSPAPPWNIVHYVEGSELADTDQAITHKIHAPAVVDLLLLNQWLFYSDRESASLFAFYSVLEA
jgi:hypothetical protein